MGWSVSFNVEKFEWYRALMGITVRPGASDLDSDTRDHEGVVDELKKIDEFHMPFITSGVGQQWGDIMVELRFKKLNHINDLAKRLRAVPEVESTKTYLFTKTHFDDPFKVDDLRPWDYCGSCGRRT
ncbi:MAG: hypothetical protein ABEI86_14565 [Halobacteriaceae archaeon]